MNNIGHQICEADIGYDQNGEFWKTFVLIYSKNKKEDKKLLLEVNLETKEVVFSVYDYLKDFGWYGLSDIQEAIVEYNHL